MVRRLGALVVAIATASVMVVTPVSARPIDAPAFNVPHPWGTPGQRSAILRKVESAINHTPKGQTMLISSYLFDQRSSVNALISACRRGVSVRVVLDGQIASHQSRRLVAALNGDNIRPNGHGGWTKPKTRKCGRRLAGHTKVSPDAMSAKQIQQSVSGPTGNSRTWGKDKSYVKKCSGSCRGTGALMHAKFYAFSRTSGIPHVIMVSSSNLNDGGAVRGWNDLAAMKRRPKSFKMYEAIHLEMTQDDEGDDRGKFEVVDGPYTSRFFPWPGTGRKGDPVMKDLNKIGCHGPRGRTLVQVSMFYWKGTRGNYIATKLLSLAHHGCQVSIIYGAPSNQIASRLRAAAGAGVINLFDSRWWFDDGDTEVDVRTHSKYILVNGRYGGRARSWQVMMGTANWTPGSLVRADENSINIASASVWRAYSRNWTFVRNHSRRVPGGGGGQWPPSSALSARGAH